MMREMDSLALDMQDLFLLPVKSCLTLTAMTMIIVIKSEYILLRFILTRSTQKSRVTENEMIA